MSPRPLSRAATAALLGSLAAALIASPAARASDEKGFAALKAEYEKAAKKHDPDGVRERRRLLLRTFDFLDQKACRKLLRQALDEEDEADTRVAVVQVLAASPDPKDLDAVVKAIARDRLRGPTIALGEGLSFADPAAADAVAAHAVGLAAKAKGDLRLALFEGIGEAGSAAAFEPLLALGEKWLPEEHYLRNVALGACGKDKAVARLASDMKASTGLIRRGAVAGLARTDCKDALAPLAEALHDTDPRNVEVAAAALAKAKHQPAAPALADAMLTAPLRVKCALRAALVEILGKDYGLDGAAWRNAIEAKGPAPAVVPAAEPKHPEFFGIPVASDRVVVLLDKSHSMAWNERLSRCQQEIERYLSSLDDKAAFAVVACDKNVERFADALVSGSAIRAQAQAWLKKQLGGSGFDLKSALVSVLETFPDADTILLATDSMPWGEGAAESASEVLEVFRATNRTRAVRVHVAFVVPGGRVTTSELEPEFEDRAFLLGQLAKESGGTFVRVEK
jgi:HEAT repeat protein